MYVLPPLVLISYPKKWVGNCWF